jgi:hypothetical protein
MKISQGNNKCSVQLALANFNKVINQIRRGTLLRKQEVYMSTINLFIPYVMSCHVVSLCVLWCGGESGGLNGESIMQTRNELGGHERQRLRFVSCATKRCCYYFPNPTTQSTRLITCRESWFSVAGMMMWNNTWANTDSRLIEDKIFTS